MDLTVKIEQKFKKLLEEGHRLLEKGGWDGKGMKHFPSDREYLRFKTGVANLIRLCFGKDSDHYREVLHINKQEEETNYPALFPQYMGILEAAYQDFSDGFLDDLRRLVRADLHSDFLEQAETLFEQGYHIAAACLTGAVLEDSLRKLCVKNEIIIPGKSAIGKHNDFLKKAGVYDNYYHKQIEAYAVVRNNADHAHYDDVKKEQVSEMINWVKRFDAEYLK